MPKRMLMTFTVNDDADKFGMASWLDVVLASEGHEGDTTVYDSEADYLADLADLAEGERVEPCIICANPTSANYPVVGEPEGMVGPVRTWVFLCEEHPTEGDREA